MTLRTRYILIRNFKKYKKFTKTAFSNRLLINSKLKKFIKLMHSDDVIW